MPEGTWESLFTWVWLISLIIAFPLNSKHFGGRGHVLLELDAQLLAQCLTQSTSLLHSLGQHTTSRLDGVSKRAELQSAWAVPVPQNLTWEVLRDPACPQLPSTTFIPPLAGLLSMSGICRSLHLPCVGDDLTRSTECLPPPLRSWTESFPKPAFILPFFHKLSENAVFFLLHFHNHRLILTEWFLIHSLLLALD